MLKLLKPIEQIDANIKKDSLFIIDRQNKANISLNDLEYDIKTFAEEYNGKLILICLKKILQMYQNPLTH